MSAAQAKRRLMAHIRYGHHLGTGSIGRGRARGRAVSRYWRANPRAAFRLLVRGHRWALYLDSRRSR